MLGSTLDGKVYRKPALWPLPSFSIELSTCEKRSCAKHRAATICHKQPDCSDKIDILSHDLQLSAYLIGFIESFISGSKRNICLKKVQPLGCLSERLKCITNRYSIRTDFKTRHTLTNSLMRTRSIRTPQETANCVYFISCK